MTIIHRNPPHSFKYFILLNLASEYLSMRSIRHGQDLYYRTDVMSIPVDQAYGLRSVYCHFVLLFHLWKSSIHFHIFQNCHQ